MADGRITRFAGPWGFLSNFHPTLLRWEGLRYPTAEHAFQAGKTLDPRVRARIAALADPVDAKRAGRAVVLRPRWNERVRFEVMAAVLHAKFASHPTRAAALLSTGDADLVEGNIWCDQFWGDCVCGRVACAEPGANHLGRLLTELRDCLRTPVRYRVGDATDPAGRPAAIVHIVNDAGRWGAGFTAALTRRWAAPEAVYREYHTTVGLLLGSVHVALVDDGVWVVNMVAQHGVGQQDGPPVRYDALRQCLGVVAVGAVRAGAGVHMPRIGCGLGGGTWDQVEPIILATCVGVPVTVYDLPGGGGR